MKSNASVLVIEDDEAIQALLESMLTIDGYRVLSAYDGAGGLEEIAMVKPDVIILDMGLPIMNGEAFLTAYHQTPLPHVPVIGISAYVIAPEVVHSLDGFMQKPFNLTELRRTMAAVLSNYASV